MSVVIVGGGVIGCATALVLARQGQQVTVLERGELGSEASGAAAGMLAALSDEGGSIGGPFQQLCLDGLNLYQDWLPDLESTGIDVRYSRAGILHLALHDHEAEALWRRFEEQQVLAPENRWLTGEALRAEAPEANPNAVAGLLSPREHSIDPRQLVLALAELGRRAGVRFETHSPVTSLVRQGDRVTAVRSRSGVYRADSVMLAGGAWTARLAETLGAAIPVRPMRGQMISLGGPMPPLRHIIWGEGAYLVPREGEQTFVGATMEEAGFRKRTTIAGLAGLRAAAADLVPSLAGAEIVQSWAGLRPATPDGLPILGRIPGYRNAWVATGHFRNGILLTPITGVLMGQSILNDEPAERLSPFSSARFVS